MAERIREADKVEILTLQDNYIDLVARDDSAIIRRALPLKGLEAKNSILAEHGFSAVVYVTREDQTRSLLFDFGYSAHGAAFNAEALNADLTRIEALALSHGHPDHVGGLEQLTKLVGRPGLELVLHPAAFRHPRYLKVSEELKIYFPSFTRERIAAAGIVLKETAQPFPLLDGTLLFLGEIPRRTDFEKGAPSLCYEDHGQEKKDTFEDDTAIVFKLKNKGLVVLSGCAHAGIVNTVQYAREVTGEDKVMAVMGGFHLGGPDQAPVIAPTIAALKEINPDYIVPTHCTGRKAVMQIEAAMPDRFILNMSGTRLTFAA